MWETFINKIKKLIHSRVKLRKTEQDFRYTSSEDQLKLVKLIWVLLFIMLFVFCKIYHTAHIYESKHPFFCQRPVFLREFHYMPERYHDNGLWDRRTDAFHARRRWVTLTYVEFLYEDVNALCMWDYMLYRDFFTKEFRDLTAEQIKTMPIPELITYFSEPCHYTWNEWGEIEDAARQLQARDLEYLRAMLERMNEDIDLEKAKRLIEIRNFLCMFFLLFGFFVAFVAHVTIIYWQIQSMLHKWAGAPKKGV